MDKMTLKLQTVTPMFLHGHDSGTLELRPPPFKALFRYWWRAAVAEMDVSELRKGEGRLFGSADSKSPRKSPLSIRVSRQLYDSYDYALLPHKQRPFKREAYKSKQNFELRLAAPQLDEYEKIAELGFLLGGVGNRSRRGFGSIRYQDWNFQTVEELQEKVYGVLNGISPERFQNDVGNGGIQQVDPGIPLPDYPVIRAVYFGKKLCDNVDSLLQHIGRATHHHNKDVLGNGALGSASPRRASPIHIRIQKIGTQFIPIATQLHSVFPDRYNQEDYEERQFDFINTVLS